MNVFFALKGSKLFIIISVRQLSNVEVTVPIVECRNIGCVSSRRGTAGCSSWVQNICLRQMDLERVRFLCVLSFNCRLCRRNVPVSVLLDLSTCHDVERGAKVESGHRLAS